MLDALSSVQFLLSSEVRATSGLCPTPGLSIWPGAQWNPPPQTSTSLGDCNYSHRLSGATGIWTTSTSARHAVLGSSKKKKDSIPMETSSETMRPDTFFIRGSSMAELFFFVIWPGLNNSALPYPLLRLPSLSGAGVRLLPAVCTAATGGERCDRMGEMNSLFAPGFTSVVLVSRVWYCCIF